MPEAALTDLLDLWGFEEDVMIFSDGSYGFGLHLAPIDISAWDDSTINGFSVRIAQFLNGLPENLDLQFVQDIDSGRGRLTNQHAGLCKESAELTARTLCQDRIARLNALEEGGQLPTFTLSLFARRMPLKLGTEKAQIFRRTKKFQPILEDKLQREIIATRRLREDLKTTLESLGVKATPYDAETVADLIYRQWNPGRAVERGTLSTDDARSSLLFTDAVIDDQGFSLGAWQHRLVSLKMLPDLSFAAMASALQHLPYQSRLFLSIHVPNQQREIETLQSQRRLAYAMVAGKRSGVRDLDAQAKFDDLESLLETMIAQGEKVFHVSLNVVLRGKSELELEEAVSSTLLALRNMGGAEGMQETLPAFDLFSCLALPNARAKDRVRRMKTSNLADFLPLYGPWRGHETPSLLLRSRLGTLIPFDPFASELTNANQIVSGGSGSGKSFATNLLLLQLMKEKPRIFIIDIGSSYKKLCESLGGQYIPLGASGDDSINPFDRASEEETSGSKVKLLVGLVELMTKEDEVERLPKLQKAALEDAVQEIMATKAQPSLSDLRNLLLSHDDVEIKNIGKILGTWCGDTPYGRFVDRPTSVKLESSVICFDLKGMEAYPDLQAVSLLLITDYIWREIQADRSTKKVVVFDECWKLLESDAGAGFLGEIFRTFRKYYASAIAISQNIDDFAKSKVATAVLPNASIKWILRQKGADQGRLKQVLNLNDAEMGLIDSLKQERGRYSEAFLMAQDEHTVVAIEASPLEYWIATTDPRELAKIDETQAIDPSKPRLAVLSELAESYPHGLLAN